jgi:phosphoribosylaminoimidazole-succinocarboxamide synthase
VAVPDPNVLIAHAATPLPIEVVVRGYITGVTSTSLWKPYSRGARTIYGYDFPDGLEKNTPLPEPLVTPSTKPPSGSGIHDEPLTSAEVVDLGYVDAALWDRIRGVALALYDRGRQVAADAGLIFVDTKYEFGLSADGELLLIDEMHTPDSSRYWMADTYEARLSAGDEPESLDKEPARRALSDVGFRGDGELPELPTRVWTETSARYIDAYERLTGESFAPGTYPVGERVAARLPSILEEYR